MKRQLAAATALGICACLTGCFEDDAVWTPDSSGVVCLREDNSLVYFDVASGETRIIARLDCERRGELMEKPAINPQGDRVAIVRYLLKDLTRRVQVVIYDLHGNEDHRSSVFRLPDSDVPHDGTAAWLGRAHWSPDGRRILGMATEDPEVKKGEAPPPPPAEFTALFVYDLTNRKLITYPNVYEPEEVMMCGVSPFTPDNRGFLAERLETSPKPGSSTVLFIDWGGRQYPLTDSPALVQAEEQQTKERADRLRKRRGPIISALGDMSPPQWEQSKLVLPYYRGKMVFDTVRRTIDYRPDKGTSQIFEYSESHGVTVAKMRSGVLVQVRASRTAGKNRTCIEFRIRSQAGEPWRTVPVRTVDDVTGIQFSPNRRYVLMHYEDADQHGRLIVDADGQVVGDLR